MTLRQNKISKAQIDNISDLGDTENLLFVGVRETENGDSYEKVKLDVEDVARLTGASIGTALQEHIEASCKHFDSASQKQAVIDHATNGRNITEAEGVAIGNVMTKMGFTDNTVTLISGSSPDKNSAIFNNYGDVTLFKEGECVIRRAATYDAIFQTRRFDDGSPYGTFGVYMNRLTAQSAAAFRRNYIKKIRVMVTNEEFNTPAWMHIFGCEGTSTQQKHLCVSKGSYKTVEDLGTKWYEWDFDMVNLENLSTTQYMFIQFRKDESTDGGTDESAEGYLNSRIAVPMETRNDGQTYDYVWRSGDQSKNSQTVGVFQIVISSNILGEHISETGVHLSKNQAELLNKLEGDASFWLLNSVGSVEETNKKTVSMENNQIICLNNEEGIVGTQSTPWIRVSPTYNVNYRTNKIKRIRIKTAAGNVTESTPARLMIADDTGAKLYSDESYNLVDGWYEWSFNDGDLTTVSQSGGWMVIMFKTLDNPITNTGWTANRVDLNCSYVLGGDVTDSALSDSFNSGSGKMPVVQIVCAAHNPIEEILSVSETTYEDGTVEYNFALGQGAISNNAGVSIGLGAASDNGTISVGADTGSYAVQLAGKDKGNNLNLGNAANSIGMNNIAIGSAAIVGGMDDSNPQNAIEVNNSMSIGKSAKTTASNATAIGFGAENNQSGTLTLRASENSTFAKYADLVLDCEGNVKVEKTVGGIKTTKTMALGEDIDGIVDGKLTEMYNTTETTTETMSEPANTTIGFQVSAVNNVSYRKSKICKVSVMTKNPTTTAPSYLFICDETNTLAKSIKTQKIVDNMWYEWEFESFSLENVTSSLYFFYRKNLTDEVVGRPSSNDGFNEGTDKWADGAKCNLLNVAYTGGGHNTRDRLYIQNGNFYSKRLPNVKLQTGTLSEELVGNVKSQSISNIVSLTQAQYDALGTKDANTFYIITEG